ncbi:MAG: diguanylate cyclase [Pseudomonadota bacterium]|jgi:diguanylate cyclase (GGDEF)-like protein|nr:diguanylate cyclase [Pseudomonadota bacterium]
MLNQGFYMTEKRAVRAKGPFTTGPLVIGLAHFVVALINIRLTGWSVGMATVWAANALVLAVLLVVPTRRWTPYVISVWIAGFAANLLGGYPAFAAAPFAALNIAEAALAALFTRRLIGGPLQLEHPDHLLKFIGSSIIAAAFSASFSAPFMSAAVDEAIGRSWLSWFASDTLGLLLVTPILLIVFAIWSGKRSFLQGRSVVEAAALFALVTGLSILVFAQTRWPMLFLLLPPMLLTTFRLRSAGATVAIVTVACIGSYFTTIGSGPIALMPGDLADRIYFFQFFLAVAFLPALPVAAVLDERDALAAIAERQASTDELTGTASRRMFLARLEAAGEAANANGTAFSVALFDVDHFKSVNDRFGHDVGDAVLRHVGALAMAIVGRHGLVGRLGGEEFAVLMPGRSLDQAAGLCEALRKACSDTDDMPEGVVPVTISVGVAALARGRVPADVLKDADAAMYLAKSSGRDRVQIVR